MFAQRINLKHMSAIASATLAIAGLFAGILAGFLGIGGGTLLVPISIALGYTPVQAVATSSVSIAITAWSGTVQNWRMGYFSLNRVLGIALPAIVTAQFGAELASRIAPNALLTAFGCLLLLNIYLVQVRKTVTRQKEHEEARSNGVGDRVDAKTANRDRVTSKRSNYLFYSRLFTGSLAGLLAGLFGVGGGVIMVPLQILLLNTNIKTAIQTSLGAIAITAISSTIGHAVRGNVLWVPGLLLGMGGLVGAQISTRFLPKLPERIINLAFRTLLFILSIYIFWQAWQQY